MSKPRSTYAVRREEVKRLRVEVEQLTAELAVLNTPTFTPDEAELAELILQQTVMVAAARSQQFRLARAQALQFQCMNEREWNPLYTTICIGKEYAERRATLLKIRPQKLKNAYEYVTASCPIEYPLMPQHSDERFETTEGDICCVHVEVAQFPGVKSIQQVFNALKFYVDNVEIIISEQLGHITVREDYDAVEGRAYSARLLSRNQNGLMIENNVVGFASVSEGGDQGITHEPCAVIAIDSVDQDALHPYVSSERVRRDISVAIVLTASHRQTFKKEECGSPCDASAFESALPYDEGELVVTMRRVAFLKVYRPEFSVSKATLQDLQMGVAQWGDLMMKTIREELNASVAVR